MPIAKGLIRNRATGAHRISGRCAKSVWVALRNLDSNFLRSSRKRECEASSSWGCTVVRAHSSRLADRAQRFGESFSMQPRAILWRGRERWNLVCQQEHIVVLRRGGCSAEGENKSRLISRTRERQRAWADIWRTRHALWGWLSGKADKSASVPPTNHTERQDERDRNRQHGAAQRIEYQLPTFRSYRKRRRRACKTTNKERRSATT